MTDQIDLYANNQFLLYICYYIKVFFSPITYNSLLLTSYSLPATNYLLPVTNYLVPVFNFSNLLNKGGFGKKFVGKITSNFIMVIQK